MSKYGVGVGDDFPIDEGSNDDRCPLGHEGHPDWHHRRDHRHFRRGHFRHHHHYNHHNHSPFFRWSFRIAKILIVALIGAEIGGHFAVSLVGADAHLYGVYAGAAFSAFLALLFILGHRHRFDAAANSPGRDAEPAQTPPTTSDKK